MTKSRGINRPKWRPTPEQLEVVRAKFPHMRTADLAAQLGVGYHQLQKCASGLGLRKSEEFLTGPEGGRLDGVRGGGARFAKGHVPWTKGRKFPGGLSPQTLFKAGKKPHNYLPTGSYRIGAGYLQRKVSETGYPPHDWQMVHRLVWQEAHGPIPDGYAVAFRPGRRSTVLEEITLDALELVEKAEVMRRNSISNLPPELVELVRLRGVVTREINKRSKR